MRWIAARLVLYFFATLIILTVLSFRFMALWPLVGASHVCRKTFILAFLLVLSGPDALIIRSRTLTHVGRDGVSVRYSCSHIMSIASFLALMSSRLSPPWFMGF